jgi:hypothetical protein
MSAFEVFAAVPSVDVDIAFEAAEGAVVVVVVAELAVNLDLEHSELVPRVFLVVSTTPLAFSEEDGGCLAGPLIYVGTLALIRHFRDQCYGLVSGPVADQRGPTEAAALNKIAQRNLQTVAVDS